MKRFDHVVLFHWGGGPLFSRFEEVASAVRVLTRSFDSRFRWIGIRPLRRQLSFWTYRSRLSRCLERVGADLVHLHYSSALKQVEAVLLDSQLPLIWTVHNSYRQLGRVALEGEERWNKTVDLVCRHSSGHITACSQGALDDVVCQSRQVEDKVSVIFNAVDPAFFRLRSDAGASLRRSLGLDRETVLVGSAARLDEHKRHDLFVAALGEVLRRGHSVHGVIAGEGMERRRLEAAIQAEGIADRCQLLGNVEDMSEFYGALDVFVLCSDVEGFGLVLAEAGAAGVPCIATAVGGVPEVLAGGVGLLVEPGQREPLVSSIIQLMEPTRRCELGGLARENSKRFSVSHVSRQYAELYERYLAAN